MKDLPILYKLIWTVAIAFLLIILIREDYRKEWLKSSDTIAYVNIEDIKRTEEPGKQEIKFAPIETVKGDLNGSRTALMVTGCFDATANPGRALLFLKHKDGRLVAASFPGKGGIAKYALREVRKDKVFWYNNITGWGATRQLDDVIFDIKHADVEK